MPKLPKRLWSFAILLPLLSGSSAFSGTFSFDFANTNYITIRDSQNPPTTASIYPSVINVAGLSNLLVTDVTVTLSNFSHTFPSDVSMLLVGPQGQQATLLSGVGGADTAYPVSNVVLSLNDADPDPLPIHDTLFPGSFHPTVLDPTLLFNFPSPAPAGSSNAPVALSVFHGTDPNGPWKLYIVDGAAGDDGSLSGGWGLTLSTSVLLKATAQGTNLVLSWPAVTNGAFSLQFSSAFTNSGGWSNLSGNPTLVSNRYTLTNTLPKSTNTHGFFRLTGQ